MGRHKDVPRDAPLCKSVSGKCLSGAQAAALQLDSFLTGLLRLLVLLSQQVPDPQPHHSVLKEQARRGGRARKALAALWRGLGALEGWVLSAGRRRIAHIPANLSPAALEGE